MSTSDIINSTEQSGAPDNLYSRFHVWLAKPRSRRVAVDIIALFDVAAIVIGGLVPTKLYTLSGPGIISSSLTAIQWSLVVSVIIHVGMRKCNLYDITKLHNFPMAPGKIALCLAIAFAAVLGIGLPFTASDAHMWIWYAAWASTSFTLLIGNRIIANWLLGAMTAAGSFNTRIAVYGTGNIAGRLENYLRNAALGISFAGVFDDRTDNGRTDGDGPAPTGRMADLIKAGRSGQIDQIIIALPQAADYRTALIARQLELLPVSVHVCTHIASDLVDDDAVRSVSQLGPVGLLDVKHNPLSDWAPLFKSAEDYILGLFLTVAALPVLALAALAIKLDSRGSVFRRARRRGANDKSFSALTFRTTALPGKDRDDTTGAAGGEPRTTRVGRVLRRYQIDKLPQLFNVLKGEMSLVGPRPLALYHNEQHSDLLRTYADRHQLKPGITGPAQISSYRGDAKDREEEQNPIDQDLAYIRGWSLRLDLKILAETLRTVFMKKRTS